MGREVRRVPLDFNWPLEKVWEGYVTPDRLLTERCPDCDRGYTSAGEWLQTLCSRIDMLAEDIVQQQRGRPLHPWLAQDGYPPHDQKHRVMRPSEDIIDLIVGLTGESRERILNPMRGGDGYLIARKLIEASGLPEGWGMCPTCEGHGSVERYEGQRAEAEAWEPTDPPTGEGWQLWSTVSEGSPISPVLTTAQDLARWMSDPARGSNWVPEGAAANFIEVGWAPSGAFSSATGVVQGVEWVGHHSTDQ